RAGIARVVVGVLDPFPAMQGRSVEALRAAGIEVRLGVEEEAAARRILGFARAVAVGLPEVTAKAAISADGHIATATGESQWITGPQARQHGHVLRARHDAILVGIGTALADDPRLNTRLPPGVLPGPQISRDPVPVVLDTHLRLPGTAQLLQGPGAVVICGPEAPQRELQAEIVRVPRLPGGGVDPVAALAALSERGLHRVLVEGGGRIHRTLLDAALVDNLELYLAPIVLPGGRPWVAGPPVEALEQGFGMELVETERLGPDVRLSFRLVHGTAPDPLSTLRSTPPTR
ncbi:MAG TPA: bifunctional diaminohydroxyphosphoribosylaminopyrimidine deaminase/5-amino-6-(5-phosphoribosylamino)uracil reductase RibD, partial [Deltaproteobacteria bacterium]|nr:bifunctional diaminohydroxyphosphoribosylaminopyrimidine deaminase/5-amino-6-(5-phosphoribosylamino)uracil reductase RibD [Deltaproteobacteria bacterium]